ncbi:MAG: ATP-binding protein, partial [Acidobacteriota bacterium]
MTSSAAGSAVRREIGRPVRFLADCYRADNREQELLDVFAAKVEWLRVIAAPAGFLSAAGEAQPTLPAESELAQVARRALLHRSEQSLQLGSLFVTGRLRLADDRARRLCAPLLLAPLELDEAAGELRVDLERWSLNRPLLSALAASREVPAEAEGSPTTWPEPPYSAETLGRLAAAWCAATPGIEVHRLDPGAPAAADELRRLGLRRGPVLRLAWAQAILLTRRPIDSRGVLTELNRLADEAPSAPLAALLETPRDPPAAPRGEGEGETADATRDEILAPAMLSAAQRQVVKSAHRQPLSLVIGPPGTGKSFTIAALALDGLSRGRSVLVASKMNHAVDVVGSKLEELLQLEDVAVRGGRRGYGKELKERLGRWLSGSLPAPSRGEAAKRFRTIFAASQTLYRTHARLGALEAEAQAQLRRQDERLAELESELQERSRLEIELGRSVAGEPSPLWWQRLRERWRQMRTERALDGRKPYWRTMADYRQEHEERLETARLLLQAGFLRRLVSVLKSRRRELTRFRDSVRARTVRRREDLWRRIDTPALLEALPIWLVNLQEMATLLPFEREMFDLVILDEASQCDIASCLPALQRARRAVIVGDPAQLRHLSFLPRARQRGLAERHGLDAEQRSLLDFRRRSVLDLADSVLGGQQSVAFLDEHFRSAPSIIDFSNREFYGRRLRVMQESPAHDWHRALYLHRVAGERGEDGANPAEAEAVLDGVREWLEKQESRPKGLCPTLGVLSPFRAQVDLLTRRLAESLPAQVLERHSVRVGTAHSFQGEERDVMMLSLAIDARSHPSALRFLERPDVFNVSITRARSIQHVFTSLPAAPPDRPGGLVERFLSHMAQDAGSPRETPAEDPFAREIAGRLALEGC